MKSIEVNGKTIKTNYNPQSNYQITDTDRETMCYRPAQFQETEKEMLERLVNEGFTRITFYYRTTAIRGFYKLYAYCK